MEQLVSPVLLHLCGLLAEAQGIVAVAAAPSKRPQIIIMTKAWLSPVGAGKTCGTGVDALVPQGGAGAGAAPRMLALMGANGHLQLLDAHAGAGEPVQGWQVSAVKGGAGGLG